MRTDSPCAAASAVSYSSGLPRRGVTSLPVAARIVVTRHGVLQGLGLRYES
jgi:hypothetical protein